MATFVLILYFTIYSMRVIPKRALREFWEKNPDAKIPLKEWYNLVSKVVWQNPNEIVEIFPSADIIGNNRVVFNICHNKYRLIVVFRYKIQMAFIRFIDTHQKYDKIKDIKNI
ncbi:MAG TPA: type II toxin-antitoxin system HigB family toxin [Salinimicrobium sp.]|nr:type II toxin-antitoxin system HigB family toxin [Salinimicrobium sp.]